MKLIFYSITPISSTYGRKINLEWFLNKGIETEFWNLSRINYSKSNIKNYYSFGYNYRYNFINEKKFYNKKDVIKNIQVEDKNTFFCSIDFGDHDHFWILRQFKKSNLNYFVTFRTNGFWSKSFESKSFFEKIRQFNKKISNYLKDYNFFRIFSLQKRFRKIIYKNTNYYQKPLFVVGSGTSGKIAQLAITQAQEFLSVPSPDILWTTSNRQIDYDYGVFIDDTIFHSPDLALNFNIKNRISNDKLEIYKKNINRCFKLIEETLNIKIVIGASGKFDYKNDNPYCSRPIIYNKTNQLLQHSKIAIGHNSNGFYQAVIGLQPTIMLIDDIFTIEKKNKIFLIAEFLNLKPINTNALNAKIINEISINNGYIHKLTKKYFNNQKVSEIQFMNDLIYNKIKNLEFLTNS